MPTELDKRIPIILLLHWIKLLPVKVSVARHHIDVPLTIRAWSLSPLPNATARPLIRRCRVEDHWELYQLLRIKCENPAVIITTIAVGAKCYVYKSVYIFATGAGQ